MWDSGTLVPRCGIADRDVLKKIQDIFWYLSTENISMFGRCVAGLFWRGYFLGLSPKLELIGWELSVS